jgi:hypothetical protein
MVIDVTRNNKRTWVAVRNPRWAFPDGKGFVLLTVRFQELPFEVDFVACPDDCEPHGRDLHQRAINGDFGPIAAFQPLPTEAPALALNP